MARHILLIRQSSALRSISADEAVQVLTEEERTLERHHIEVPTAQFADAIMQGDWGGQDAFLREAAARIRAEADRFEDSAIHFLGLAEVPHLIALGAHVGYERVVVFHDHHGEAGPWRWPETGRTVELTTAGTDDLTATVTARGAAVLRVSISATISEADVREAVGDGTLADIELTLAHRAPQPGTIRSDADVEAVRQAFRTLYCMLRNKRPGIEVIHLFVSAPPSMCFVIGQELTLRNAPPVQTYRYRTGDGTMPAQQPAILLSDSAGRPPLAPLTEVELATAAHVRSEIWPAALQDVERYVANKSADRQVDGLWFDSFTHRSEVRCAAPFPTLPSLASFVPREVDIDPEPYAGDFAFNETKRRWHLNDRLLVALRRAADGSDERLRQLIRLFLFHEYVHLFHSIGKHTAAEVGKFANCLEHIDYTADTYALLHQLDLCRYNDSKLLSDLKVVCDFLADQIELALRSFWAFDVDAGNEWQVRRIRRYLNWYWRQIQIESAQSVEAIMMLFSRQPRLEIGGLYQVARGRRVIAFLDRIDKTTHLELAIVMENEKLFRLSDGPNTNLGELLASFGRGEHERIQQFFRSVYDTAQGQGAAVQPATSPVMRTPPRKG